MTSACGAAVAVTNQKWSFKGKMILWSVLEDTLGLWERESTNLTLDCFEGAAELGAGAALEQDLINTVEHHL